MWIVEGISLISEDGTVTLPIPPEVHVPPGEYEVRLIWKEPPQFFSPVDPPASVEATPGANTAVMQLSEGSATIMEDSMLIFSVPHGTRPGSYDVVAQIFESMAERLRNPTTFH